MKVTDIGAAYDPQFERVEMSDKLRAAASIGWDRPCFLCRSHPCDRSCPEKEQEPVAYIRVSKTGNVTACAKTGDFYKLPEKTLLYPAPPRREWVGLTDDEINKEAKEKFVDYNFMSGFLSGASFAEAKLKEKNT